MEETAQPVPPVAPVPPAPSAPTKKVNFWMVISILLVIMMAAGVAFYVGQNLGKKGPAEETKEAGLPSSSPEASEKPATSPVTAGLVSLDSTWNKYTNPTLGFSLKVLKNMIDPYGQCLYSTSNGDHSYRPKEAAVPVKIFETTDNVYLAAEFTYKLTGETKEGGKSYFAGCDKVENTALLVANRQNYFSPAWRIIIKKITSDAELTQFLKDRYGTGCSLGEKKASSQSGVFNIAIKGDGLDLSETKCPINYMTVVKYYPAKQKVAAWDIGQACSFYYPTVSTCLDTEMTDSFTF